MSMMKLRLDASSSVSTHVNALLASSIFSTSVCFTEHKIKGKDIMFREINLLIKIKPRIVPWIPY